MAAARKAIIAALASEVDSFAIARSADFGLLPAETVYALAAALGFALAVSNRPGREEQALDEICGAVRAAHTATLEQLAIAQSEAAVKQ